MAKEDREGRPAKKGNRSAGWNKPADIRSEKEAADFL
jgi:hypothetical protein